MAEAAFKPALERRSKSQIADGAPLPGEETQPRLVSSTPGPASGQLKAGEIASLKQRLALAEQLLGMEAELRSLESRAELNFYAVNEFYKNTGAEQVFIHAPARRHAAGTILAVKGLASLDPNAPLLRWLQSEIDIAMRVRQTAFSTNTDEQADGPPPFQYRLNSNTAPGGTFATPCVSTIPLIDSRTGRSLGALSYLSRRTLEPNAVALAQRQCNALASALSPFISRRAWPSAGKMHLLGLTVLLLAALAMFIPVSMRVLAPATVQPASPEVVAAPISGVIETIHVSPNETVDEGDALFTFNATQFKNEFELAAKEVAVAEARYKRAGQDAFLAADGRRELSIAKAELILAIAEKEAAERRLERVVVHAANSGIVLYSGKEDWVGRPVSTGERVMRIADPSQMRVDIDLAVEDNVRLPDGAPVNVFLDADPLNPVSASLTVMSYEAALNDENRLVFKFKAQPLEADRDRLRLGLKGTAQIIGEDVPLWYFLFRKPLSFLRQAFGF